VPLYLALFRDEDTHVEGGHHDALNPHPNVISLLNTSHRLVLDLEAIAQALSLVVLLLSTRSRTVSLAVSDLGLYYYPNPPPLDLDLYITAPTTLLIIKLLIPTAIYAIALPFYLFILYPAFDL